MDRRRFCQAVSAVFASAILFPKAADTASQATSQATTFTSAPPFPGTLCTSTHTQPWIWSTSSTTIPPVHHIRQDITILAKKIRDQEGIAQAHNFLCTVINTLERL